MTVDTSWMARVHIVRRPSWNPAYLMAVAIEAYFGREFEMPVGESPW